MTTEFAVLLPADERPWVAADLEARRGVYSRHTELRRLLRERGHTITGGAELRHSGEARLVRGERGATTVTSGPCAQTVEQLGGFHVLRAPDLDTVLELASIRSASTTTPWLSPVRR